MKPVILILAMALGGVCGAQDNKTAPDKMYRAGKDGVGSPACVRCPQADSKGVQGTVLLDVTVTTEGQVTNPIVLKAPADALAELAVKQVKKWKMRPAMGPEGKPVNCRVQIEMTFHN